MRVGHVAIALLVSAVVLLVGNLVFSGYNDRAFAELQRHHERLSAHVDELRALQRELVATAELYRRSSDAIAVEARSLQYYRDAETVIRPVDGPSEGFPYHPGTHVMRPPVSDDRRSDVRVAALATFLLVLLIQLVAATRRPERHEIRRASR